MQKFHLSKGPLGWELRMEGEEARLYLGHNKEQAIKTTTRTLQLRTASLLIHQPDGDVPEELMFPRSAKTMEYSR